jgi:hypothetical protein
MSNTHIQILRSRNNATPNKLVDGEMAYSFVSDTLFIGEFNPATNSNSVIRIAGGRYTQNLENATPQDIPDTLVLRDANGVSNVILTMVDGGGF